jgi:hypothetical protein
MGDLFNRGPGALRALRLLLRLQREAKRAGGKVTVLLGNHEAMTALRHEGYCTEEEYLAFATARERKAWPGQVNRALRRLLRQRPGGVLLPIEPRLEAWKVTHVPGRAALRRALGPRGSVGKALRRLPVAYQTQGYLFVHAGLLPSWAEHGVEGLNELARQAWKQAGRRLWSLPKTSLFRAADGPLWDRSLVRAGRHPSSQLRQTLALLGAERMIVGHTQTASLRGGREGTLAVLARGQLIGVDVGLGADAHAPRTALIIDGPRGLECNPGRTRVLWTSRGVRG